MRYQREDGLDLNATLYLPPGYERERDGRLPCLLWAYPREYKSRARPWAASGVYWRVHGCCGPTRASTSRGRAPGAPAQLQGHLQGSVLMSRCAEASPG